MLKTAQRKALHRAWLDLHSNINSKGAWFIILVLLIVLIIFTAYIGQSISQSVNQLISQSVTASEKCSNGPYVFDPLSSWEGIGSTFQWRKHGLIIANALEIPWIGLLENLHDDPPRQNYAMDMFGLSDPNDCDFETLMNITKANKNRKWSIHRGEELMNVSEMCSRKKSGIEYQKELNLNKHSIIIAPDKRCVEDLNFCVFNEQFRDRYHAQQQKAGMIAKPTDEFWISVHFRMLDGKDEPDDGRNGYRSLEQLANDTAVYVKKFPNAKLFFISEGSNESIYANFTKIVPNVAYLLDSDWKEALWKMANSNVLIGGGVSSFSTLGAMLNDKSCLVDAANGYKMLKHSSVPQSAVNMTLASAKEFV